MLLSVVSVVLVLTAFGNIMDLSNDKEGDTSPLMGSEVVSEYSNSGDQVGSPSPTPGVEPTSSQTPTLDTQDDSEDIDPALTEAPSSVVNSSPGVDEEPPVVSPTESAIPQEEQGSTPQIEPFASRRISPLYGYNSEEKNACLERLGFGLCAKAKALGDQATSQAQMWYPESMLHNGAGDAFRHCYWSALMTRNISVFAAALVGDWHEHYAYGQPASEKSMDLYNNARGRDVAKMTASDSHAANYCFHASLKGTLKVLVK